MTLYDQIQQRLDQLEAAVHAHLCRVQARQDALELMFLAGLPQEQQAAARAKMWEMEQSRLEARLTALDLRSGQLSAHAAEIAEEWLLVEQASRELPEA